MEWKPSTLHQTSDCKLCTGGWAEIDRAYINLHTMPNIVRLHGIATYLVTELS